MTNEEAINHLKCLRVVSIGEVSKQALDVAIKALETGEVYMNGEDYNLFLEGYKDGIGTYKQMLNENKALQLLLDWVLECDSFGYDNIPEEYERYKDEIEGMTYKAGLIYIAGQIIKDQENRDA